MSVFSVAVSVENCYTYFLSVFSVAVPVENCYTYISPCLYFQLLYPLRIVTHIFPHVCIFSCCRFVTHIFSCLYFQWLYLLKVFEDPEMYRKMMNYSLLFENVNAKYKVINTPNIIPLLSPSYFSCQNCQKGSQQKEKNVLEKNKKKKFVQQYKSFVYCLSKKVRSNKRMLSHKQTCFSDFYSSIYQHKRIFPFVPDSSSDFQCYFLL